MEHEAENRLSQRGGVVLAAGPLRHQREGRDRLTDESWLFCNLPRDPSCDADPVC
jgi:hypothetical protein